MVKPIAYSIVLITQRSCLEGHVDVIVCLFVLDILESKLDVVYKTEIVQQKSKTCLWNLPVASFLVEHIAVALLENIYYVSVEIELYEQRIVSTKLL